MHSENGVVVGALRPVASRVLARGPARPASPAWRRDTPTILSARLTTAPAALPTHLTPLPRTNTSGGMESSRRLAQPRAASSRKRWAMGSVLRLGCGSAAARSTPPHHAPSYCCLPLPDSYASGLRKEHAITGTQLRPHALPAFEGGRIQPDSMAI